jgi:uncharacterized protein (TIGR03085 family)
MRLVPAEREAISRLFTELGPEAPTVLPGWRARELMAHLLVRERNPAAAPGILIPPLAAITDRAMARYSGMPWDRQVDLLRGGPPPWTPYWLPQVDERVNLAEYFVHHEDLARARAGWQPRVLPDPLAEGLWSMLRLTARVFYRRSPVGVVLHHATRERGAEINAKAGSPRVVLAGSPGELLLHAFGREQVRLDDVVGAPADIAALEATPRGI